MDNVALAEGQWFNGTGGRDVFGNVYPYFLGKFAAAEGKLGGEEHQGRIGDISIFGQESNPTTGKPAHSR